MDELSSVKERQCKDNEAKSEAFSLDPIIWQAPEGAVHTKGKSALSK